MKVNGKTIKKNLVWSLTESFGVKLFSTFVFFYLAGILGPGPFGLVALSKAFILLGDIFIEQGFISALVQRKDLEKKHLDSAFWTNWGIGIFLYGILFLAAPFIADLYSEPILSSLLRVGGLTFIIGPTGLAHQAVLTRNFQFKQIAISRIVGIIVGGIAGIIAALVGLGVWSLIIQQLIFVSLSSAGFWLYSTYKPSLDFSQRHFQEIFSFGIKMLLNKITLYLSKSSTELIIGFFLGAELLGIYSFANKIYMSSIEVINHSVSKIMLPLFSSVQQDMSKLKGYLYQAIENVYYVLIPLLIGIVFLSAPVIDLVFGDKWISSIPVIQWLSFAGTIFMIFYYSNNALVSIGRPGLTLKFNLFYAGLNVILVTLASQVDLVLVAQSQLLISFLLIPIAWYFLSSAIPVKISEAMLALKSPLLIGLVVGLTFFILEHSLKNEPLIKPIAQIFVGLISYIGMLYYFKPTWMLPILKRLKLQ